MTGRRQQKGVWFRSKGKKQIDTICTLERDNRRFEGKEKSGFFTVYRHLVLMEFARLAREVKISVVSSFLSSSMIMYPRESLVSNTCLLIFDVERRSLMAYTKRGNAVRDVMT